MTDLIQEKLNRYECRTREDEENAIKEITQEVILYSLQQAGFFEKASFQGGTCLRIVHGLERFSEDLDFCLREVDLHFNLNPYLKDFRETMNLYGHHIEVTGEDKVGQSVRTRFLKDNCIKKLLQLEHKHDLRKKIQIKIEVDINPPQYSQTKASYLDFPLDFMVMSHDLPSLMAGKVHALLCRTYTKGRDWYDYLWYVRKEVSINFSMLEHALNQAGPWKGSSLQINKEWLKHALEKKIQDINWENARKDVERFLRGRQKEATMLWSEGFFLQRTEKLFRIFMRIRILGFGARKRT